MTDYLDELLEQQMQDKQGDGPEWRRLGTRVYAARQRGGAGADEMMVQNHGSAVDETPQRGGLRAAAALLTQQMDRLHRAVRQAQGQSSRSAVSVQGGVQPVMTSSLHAGPLAVRRAADYAAAVDAAFQRDARRYDGPLSLL